MPSLEIVVYGSEAPCPSCLHAPSSKETKEWIEAAVQRKFPGQDLPIRYVDIENPKLEKDHEFCERILADEFFYPLVVINGEIAGEGDPRLKTIYKTIEKYGFKPVSLKG
ncbi:MAG TPA: DUF1462 family protein [Bacillales bacterium]